MRQLLLSLFLIKTEKKAIDKFENGTDKRCIEHGLGYQLLAWSTEVRQNLKIRQWKGANNAMDNRGVAIRERYMSPQTIRAVMEGMKIYKN